MEILLYVWVLNQQQNITWKLVQRRDAENAEGSAEKTKKRPRKANRLPGWCAECVNPALFVQLVFASLRLSPRLCIAILKNFVILHKFHAALDSSATVACCAADMAVIATRPRSVRR